MTRSDSEIQARTFNGVRVAVTLGAGHGKSIGGDEFVERSALGVGGDVGAFGHGDLQEVASNASQGDGLRRSGTFIGGRHPLQRELIDGEEKGGTDEKADKSAHVKDCGAGLGTLQAARWISCVRKQHLHFRLELWAVC